MSGWPRVIWINGPTSAGKSTLARALQSRLPGSWMVLGVDAALGWMTPAWLTSPDGFRVARQEDGAAPIRLGAAGRLHAQAWRAMARAGVDAGLSLIIDDVAFERAMRDLWLEALGGLDVVVVGVHCDLAECQRREQARGDRVIGQALAQHGAVHDAMRYDVEVDTGACAVDACVAKVLAALEQPRSAFATMCSPVA